MPTQFNFVRAAEGALTTALIAGAGAYQVASTQPQETGAAIAVTIIVTVLVTFIKGVGQSYQQALVSTTITETVATAPTPPPPETPK